MRRDMRDERSPGVRRCRRRGGPDAGRRRRRVAPTDSEAYACHGVTSLENPVPVDRDTAFLLGSVTKTYTATALMCLVADGQVS